MDSPNGVRRTEGEAHRPLLHVVKNPDLGRVIKLYKRLTGWSPTPEEIECRRKILEGAEVVHTRKEETDEQ
jgi:hypothetical protein